jgi:hypothetical protein
MLMIEAGTKNGEMRRGAALAVVVLGLLDHRQAADARADHARRCARPALLRQRLAGGQPGILHRLDGAAMP